jgi:DNA-binding CsgD family transcriptional regulator
LSFEGFGNDNDDYQGPLWYSPGGSVPIERLQMLAEHVYEHCLVADALGSRINRAVTVSDYLSLQQFRRTTLYNEFFRYLETDRQLTVGIQINPQLIVTTSLCRLRKDFTVRDRLAMELLTPHLRLAFHNAQFVTRMKGGSARTPGDLAAAKLGMITIDQNGRQHLTSPAATQLLRKYYLCTADSLPDEIRRFATHYLAKFECEFYPPPAPLEVHRPYGTLRIKFTYRPITRSAALFLEELPCSPDLVLPVTPREVEVLTWISCGKTDSEIATLLGISVRTVHKHIEHIFDKLGVETRTAAMARFMDSQPSHGHGCS